MQQIITTTGVNLFVLRLFQGILETELASFNYLSKTISNKTIIFGLKLKTVQ